MGKFSEHAMHHVDIAADRYGYSLAADKWGRKWLLIIDIVLFSVINLASGFAPNLATFIGLRAVFGIGKSNF